VQPAEVAKLMAALEASTKEVDDGKAAGVIVMGKLEI